MGKQYFYNFFQPQVSIVQCNAGQQVAKIYYIAGAGSFV